MDPLSAHSATPLLYVDCEGLEGGEREPIGAKLRKERLRALSMQDLDDDDERLFRSRYACSERELLWAKSIETKGREFIVTNLYPRILYTFSDVIVFVLKNPR
jgi:hypothetical protein